MDRNVAVALTVAGLRVALRKESVDRNVVEIRTQTAIIPSLSARRAWIEIDCPNATKPISGVALRKESVDRNNQFARQFGICGCRSPQGERG